MFTPALLFAALLAQEQVSLEVGKPIEGVVNADSSLVQTPALDANYAIAPTVGNAYSVKVSKPGTYTCELASFDFDSYLVFTDADGVLLAEDDDGLFHTDSRIVVSLEAEKTYSVRACAMHGKMGKFRLSLLAGAPPTLSHDERLTATESDFKSRLDYVVGTLGEKSEDYASLQMSLGDLYFEYGKFGLARVEWESALEIREELFGPRHQTIAHSLNSLARLLHVEAQYKRSLTLYQRSLGILEEVYGTEHPNTALLLDNISVLYADMGNFEEAVPLCERALRIRERVLHPFHPSIAFNLNNLASSHIHLGNSLAARPLLERALAITEKEFGPKHPSTAVSLYGLAHFLHTQGELERARPMFERVLAIREAAFGPDHPEVAMSLVSLATLLQNQGNFDAALPLFLRALEIQENVLRPAHPKTAFCLNNLALLYKEMGHDEKARPLLERALTIREKELGSNHPETAQGLLNLAYFLASQQEYGDAIPLFRRALVITEQVYGREHLYTAKGLNNLASVLQAQKKYQEARPLLERSLAVMEKINGPNHPTTCAIHFNLANLLVEEGKFKDALPFVQKNIRGALAYLDHELPSMNEAERLRLLEISARPGNLIHVLHKLPEEDHRESYSLFLQWKGKATRLQSAKVRFSASGGSPSIRKKRGEIQALAKELSSLVLLPSKEQKADHAQEINSLRQTRLRIERELNREIGLDSVLATPGLSEIQKGMPKDSVLLDFFVGTEVSAWVLHASGELHLISLGSADSLRAAQAAFLKERVVRGGRQIGSPGPDRAAQFLSALWEPLRSVVGNAQTVFICPDSFLCELPFGILLDSGQKYLLEKHQFVYLTDPTRLADSGRPSVSDEGTLLVVGGINYFRKDEASGLSDRGPTSRSRIGDSWSSLPATREEMQFLSDMHEFILEWESPKTVIEGKAATEERIRAELPGKRYIHLATHGYFEPEHLPSLILDAREKQLSAQIGEQIQAVGLLPGLLSGLVFAGVNGEPDSARDDGYLSAEEIQHLDLSACDLIVLSACETALGSARSGDGLMSLRRSFSVAGADTVISSLWKVDDQATSQLMKDFYTNLWEKGMSRGEALHQAKVRMLHRNRIHNDGDASPSTWGAFVLSGNWN